MMHRVDPTVNACLVECVSACLADRPLSVLSLSGDDAGSFLDLAYANRLEGFLYPALSVTGGQTFPPHAWETLRQHYHHRLMLGFSQLKAGAGLMAALNIENIPCLGLRGPFSALDAYRDVAARRFFDLDILVPRAKARDALSRAEAAGYRRSTPELPVGFFLRHHLHWQLFNREAGVMTDLHWAVDHPYTLYRIPYEDVFKDQQRVEHSGISWMQPGPEHQVLISCIHLVKHIPSAFNQVHQPDALQAFSREGRLSHWLDLAMLIKRYREQLNWDKVWQCASDWNALEAVSAGMVGMQLLAPAISPPSWPATYENWLERDLLPDLLTDNKVSAYAPSRFLMILAAWGGFRASRVADYRTFLKPPDSYFRPSRGMGLFLRRMGHGVTARCRMLVAAVDGLLCSGWAFAMRRYKKHGPKA